MPNATDNNHLETVTYVLFFTIKCLSNLSQNLLANWVRAPKNT